MNQRNAFARTPGYLLRAGLALLLAATLQLAFGAPNAESAPPSPTPTPSPVATVTPSPTATVTPKPAVSATPSPVASATRTPTATPSPTSVPAQDLAVVFFNNFCELGQPLMATVFNTSATPLNGRTIRLRLSGEGGVLEEHDHYLSLEAMASVNLPLANAAQRPWVKIELELLESPADPNLNNDSSSCGVAVLATAEPAAQSTQVSGGRAPAVSGASTRDATWRQAGSPTPPPAAQLQPTRVATRAQTTSPQPSLTPIGSAGGGLASQSSDGLLPTRTLTLIGVVFLTGGSSWAFYYLTRPPKGA